LINKEIPQLKTGEKSKIGTAEWVPWEEGPAWLKLVIEPIDKQPVEYYLTEKGTTRTGEYLEGYIVISREPLIIAKELSDLIQNLTVKDKQKGH